MKFFPSPLNVGSLCCRPPRAWRVAQDVNVGVCRLFPPNLGGIGTRVNVVAFGYTATTGGLEPFAVFSDLFKFAFLTVAQ
jgi:hypothetical protein